MGRQWDSFDVQTASTVYWKEVPVLSRMPDREEHKADLTIRIMTGVNRNNHNARVSTDSHPLLLDLPVFFHRSSFSPKGQRRDSDTVQCSSSLHDWWGKRFHTILTRCSSFNLQILLKSWTSDL